MGVSRTASIVAGMATLGLTILAAIGWLVFIAGLGAFNADSEFFTIVERTSKINPELVTLLFLPYNPYYIAAVLSPFLFIAVIVTVILLMVLRNSAATYLFIGANVAITILAGLVLTCGGAVIHTLVVVFQTAHILTNATIASFASQLSAMLAGMIIEVLFLIAAGIVFYPAAMLAQKANSEDSRNKV